MCSDRYVLRAILQQPLHRLPLTECLVYTPATDAPRPADCPAGNFHFGAHKAKRHRPRRRIRLRGRSLCPRPGLRRRVRLLAGIEPPAVRPSERLAAESPVARASCPSRGECKSVINFAGSPLTHRKVKVVRVQCAPGGIYSAPTVEN